MDQHSEALARKRRRLASNQCSEEEARSKKRLAKSRKRMAEVMQHDIAVQHGVSMWEIVRIKGDGSCLLHSIYALIHDKERSRKKLRYWIQLATNKRVEPEDMDVRIDGKTGASYAPNICIVGMRKIISNFYTVMGSDDITDVILKRHGFALKTENEKLIIPFQQMKAIFHQTGHTNDHDMIMEDDYLHEMGTWDGVSKEKLREGSFLRAADVAIFSFLLNTSFAILDTNKFFKTYQHNFYAPPEEQEKDSFVTMQSCLTLQYLRGGMHYQCLRLRDGRHTQGHQYQHELYKHYVDTATLTGSELDEDIPIVISD